MSGPLPAGSPAVLRSLNRTRILQVVRSRPAISRVELSRETGLSKPTVNEIVAGLLGAGLVREVDPTTSGPRDRPGPRPKLIVFRPEYGYVLGIDVGASKLLVFLADLSGTVIVSARRPARGPRRPGALLRELDRTVRAVLEEGRIGPDQVKAISVGMPGVVDPLTQRVTLAPQIPGWDGVDLGAILRDRFACHVLIDTEDGLSMLAEQWLGAGRGMDHAIYINVGIGIGAGILIGGERYRGARGAAGAIGHLPLAGPDVVAGADGFGKFELAAGGMAYARRGRQVASTPPGRRLLELAGGDPDAVDAEIVFRAGASGDPAALEIIDDLVARLAQGVAAVVAVLDPVSVIIGGGVSRAGGQLMEPLEREFRRLLPRPPRLVLSVLGEDAVALGAVTAAIRDWEVSTYAMSPAEEG